MIDKYLEKIKSGQSLNAQEAQDCLNSILEQDIDDQTIADLLISLAEKGEDLAEIIGFSRALISKTLPINLPKDSIDLCGTGGSSFNRFNISTTSAFILSAGDVAVVKHGNKGSKKPNGSFDLLEEIGCFIAAAPPVLEGIFSRTQLCFLFARQFHPAMKKVAPARKIAARRTIFNIIGPICNPVQPDYQIIGTTNQKTAKLIAETLKAQGRKRCLIVVGEPGIDEISISGGSQIIELKDGALQEYSLKPQDFGIQPLDYGSIPCGDAKKNAEIFLGLLEKGEPASVLNMLCLNSGAAFYCCGKVASIQAGYELSRSIISSGKAREKYQAFKKECAAIA